jgi:hypothetical protein
MVDLSQLNIPPQALQALQQQQGGGMDITAILAQLAEMSPDEVSQALQQLGVNIPPDQLHQAAESWVERAAGKQAAGGEGEDASEEESAAPPKPSDAEEAQEGEDPNSGMNDFDEAAEADDSEGEAEQAPPVGGSAGGMPSGSPNMRAGANMPQRGGPPGAGGSMDALISQALSQGDPQSMPPQLRAGGPPMSPQRGPTAPAPAAGNDPRLRAMISSIYKQGGKPPAGAPPQVIGRRR